MIQPLMPPQQTNFTGPVVTHRDATSSASNLTTYTFAGVAIGPASADRYVVVAAHTDCGVASPTVVTIGGINATLLEANDGVGLFMALVPTGTTASIVVTFSASCSRAAIGVWSVTGLTRVTPISSSKATGTSAAAATNVAVNHAGAVIAAATHAGGTGIAWTGGVSERYDTVNGNSTRYSAADAGSLAAAAVFTTTATSSASFAWRIAAISLR